MSMVIWVFWIGIYAFLLERAQTVTTLQNNLATATATTTVLHYARSEEGKFLRIEK